MRRNKKFGSDWYSRLKHLLNSNEQTDIKMRFRYDDTTNKLREIYEDKDGERKKEVQALSGPNEFTEFYGGGFPTIF